MRSLPKDLATGVLAIVAITLLCGVAFPLLITGIGQLAFPGNANGQLVRSGGHIVGSKLIGQDFAVPVRGADGRVKLADGAPVLAADPHLFQTRPSGTTPADNPDASAFANLGPNSTVTLSALRANIAAYIALNGRYVPGGLTAARVPVDAADTSASGVDPDISAGNALLQAHRVAALDGLPLGRVDALVHRFTGGRGLGFLGDPGVNVLELNLAVERISHP